MSATEETPQDIPPKPLPSDDGLLSFPNRSGVEWQRDEPKDTKPRGGRPAPEVVGALPKPETPSARKRRVEKRVGKFYLGIAKMLDDFGAKYPSEVLVSQSTEFVDSVMDVAEDDPRVYGWIDSKLTVSGYWRLAGVGLTLTLPILAYYGFAPEWTVDFLDVPSLPPDAAAPQEPTVLRAAGTGEEE